MSPRKGSYWPPQPASPRDVAPVLQVQHHVRRHPGIAAAAGPCHHGGHRRVQVSLRIDPGSRRPETGLHDVVRLVVAVPTVHRADQGEVVHHGGLLGQVLADMDSRDLGRDVLEGAADLRGHPGFHIPRVDVGRPAGHPEQYHRLPTGGTSWRRGVRTQAEQSGQGQASEPGEARLEHGSAAEDREPLADARIQEGERVPPTMVVGFLVPHSRKLRCSHRNGQRDASLDDVASATQPIPPCEGTGPDSGFSQSPKTVVGARTALPIELFLQ